MVTSLVALVYTRSPSPPSRFLHVRVISKKRHCFTDTLKIHQSAWAESRSTFPLRFPNLINIICITGSELLRVILEKTFVTAMGKFEILSIPTHHMEHGSDGDRSHSVWLHQQCSEHRRWVMFCSPVAILQRF